MRFSVYVSVSSQSKEWAKKPSSDLSPIWAAIISPCANKPRRNCGSSASWPSRKALASRPTLEMSRRLRAQLDEVSQRQCHLTQEILRQVRAVEVLERIGTPGARELLEALSRGAAGTRLTCEARAAAHRSGEQGPSTPR